MRKATLSDKQKVIGLLQESFRGVAGLRWVTGNGPDHETKLLRLLDCAVALCLHQGEIWFSRDEHAVVLFFYQSKRKADWFSLYQHLRIAIRVVGWRRVPEILRRERYIRQQQQGVAAEAIYVWFVASRHEQSGIESIVELKNALFQKAFFENLPILMETTVPKVANSFLRYGFQVYHRWYHPSRYLTVWFLKREPSAAGITLPAQQQSATA